MPKRKEQSKTDDEDSGSDVELVNVDFDFFDPSEIDFIALKRLMAQLFQADSEGFYLNELAELIISQTQVGTMVKTDGKESDPYAFLTVLNMNVHKEHPAIKAISQYILAKSISNAKFHAALQAMIGPEGLASDKYVGLLLGERLINMPVQIIPPMYRMLGEEIQWAIEENKPYKFDFYLVVSRLYRVSAQEETSLMEEESAPPSKKQKRQQKGLPTGGTFPFHHEDQCIQKFASWSHDYEFTNRQAREGPDSFGLDVMGRVMVIPGSKFDELVTAMAESYPVPGSQ